MHEYYWSLTRDSLVKLLHNLWNYFHKELLLVHQLEVSGEGEEGWGWGGGVERGRRGGEGEEGWGGGGGGLANILDYLTTTQHWYILHPP